MDIKKYVDVAKRFYEDRVSRPYQERVGRRLSERILRARNHMVDILDSEAINTSYDSQMLDEKISNLDAENIALADRVRVYEEKNGETEITYSFEDYMLYRDLAMRRLEEISNNSNQFPRNLVKKVMDGEIENSFLKSLTEMIEEINSLEDYVGNNLNQLSTEEYKTILEDLRKDYDHVLKKSDQLELGNKHVAYYFDTNTRLRDHISKFICAHDSNLSNSEETYDGSYDMGILLKKLDIEGNQIEGDSYEPIFGEEDLDYNKGSISSDEILRGDDDWDYEDPLEEIEDEF